ncbi:unnamed protein product [marine sediment metagenome]|uniref:Uncharacterized protein n=1 Tax=marine sediment metagenome TaxID=412755 RepID=X1HQ68_9ZZZZ
MIDALENSHIYYPDQYSILIKNSSVTNSTSNEIANLVLLAISLNKNGCKKDNWELCYLCRWLDRCDLYTELAKLDGVTKVVRTHSPLGLQAIMYSPVGRDIVLGHRRMKDGDYFTPIETSLGDQLNREISLGNISAACMIPNLFEFNVMLARTELDIFKLSDCRLPAEEIEEESSPGIIPFLWFVSITVGIILFAWFFYQFIAKEDYEVDPDVEGIKVVKKSGG